MRWGTTGCTVTAGTSGQGPFGKQMRRSTRDKPTYCGLAACLLDRNLHGLSTLRGTLIADPVHALCQVYAY